MAEKDFAAWHLHKVLLQDEPGRIFHFYEGEVWWCAMGLNLGFEEDGKGVQFARQY
jgi:hypothetical protein